MTTSTEDVKSKIEVSEQDIIDSLNKAFSDYKVNSKTSAKLELNIKEIADEEKPVIKRKTARTARTAKTTNKTTKTISSTKKKKTVAKVKKARLKKKTKSYSLLKLPRKVLSIPFTYKKQLLTSSLLLIMFGFVAMSGYVAYAYVAMNNNDIVSSVSSHAVLPTGETPKVYIIQSEKSEIFKNPLFKGIEVGDNVLTYTNAGKVYIYRSSEDKIVNIVNTTQ